MGSAGAAGATAAPASLPSGAATGGVAGVSGAAGGAGIGVAPASLVGAAGGAAGCAAGVPAGALAGACGAGVAVRGGVAWAKVEDAPDQTVRTVADSKTEIVLNQRGAINTFSSSCLRYAPIGRSDVHARSPKEPRGTAMFRERAPFGARYLPLPLLRSERLTRVPEARVALT